MNRIGKIIKEERLSKNLTQKDVADALGITQDSISLWENDKRIPDTEYIIKLCSVLNISADYLLGIDDELGVRVSSSSAIPSSVYSETERELIEAFRKLPSDSRALVLRMVGVEGSSSVSRKKA